MKKLVFSLAFMLIGSFAFANNTQLKDFDFKTKTESNLTSKVIDFNTFTSNFDVNSIDKESITFNVVGGSFNFTDSCGNSWTVTYWGYSFAEVVDILWALDDLLCMLG